MQQGRLAPGANLEGQVALVTGASRGIGQAIALALVDETSLAAALNN